MRSPGSFDVPPSSASYYYRNAYIANRLTVVGASLVQDLGNLAVATENCIHARGALDFSTQG